MTPGGKLEVRQINVSLYVLCAVGIAGFAWLVGVHPAMAIVAGLGFALPCAHPRFRADECVRRAMASAPADDLPLPPCGVAWSVPVGMVAGAGIGLIHIGLQPVALAFYAMGTAGVVNAGRCLTAGDAVAWFGARWGARYTRAAHPYRYWGLTAADVVVALALAAGTHFAG